MPESDQEVFEHFRTDYGNSLEIALLAYARYAQDKYEWVNQRLKNYGKAPTEQEVTNWITDLPNSRLGEIHAGAIATFRNAAEAYMKERMEEEVKRAVERSILNRVETVAQQVKDATSFRATWIPNVFVGVVASFVFTLIVLFGAAIYLRDPSPFALFKGDEHAKSQVQKP